LIWINIEGFVAEDAGGRHGENLFRRFAWRGSALGM
jgi:hypothetical protein